MKVLSTIDKAIFMPDFKCINYQGFIGAWKIYTLIAID